MTTNPHVATPRNARNDPTWDSEAQPETEERVGGQVAEDSFNTINPTPSAAAPEITVNGRRRGFRRFRIGNPAHRIR
jgi:hypothetical protein